MEEFLKELGSKVLVSLLVGYIIGTISNSIQYFRWTKKTINAIKDEVDKMNSVISSMAQNVSDTAIRVKQPDNWGLGNKETNDLLKQLITEIRDLNTNIVRLLTIVERNGFVRHTGG